jgi:hypothetical protein
LTITTSLENVGLVDDPEPGAVRLATSHVGGPGGIFVLDHFTFNVLGPREVDRGPQFLPCDFWWHSALLVAAVLVHDRLGVVSLRRLGVNFDLPSVVTLLVGGAFSLVTAAAG